MNLNKVSIHILFQNITENWHYFKRKCELNLFDQHEKTLYEKLVRKFPNLSHGFGEDDFERSSYASKGSFGGKASDSEKVCLISLFFWNFKLEASVTSKKTQNN